MATNRQLSNLVAAILEARKAVNVDFNLYPARVHPSLAIAKGDGERALAELTKDYNREISNRAAVILTQGTEASQQAFVKAATDVGGPVVLTVSALEAYTRMALDIEPTLGREREFAGTQLGHLLRSLETIGRESGSSFLKTPTLTEGVFIVREFNDLVRGVRDLLLPQVGPVLNRNYIQTSVYRQALENGSRESTIPVIVTDATDLEIEYFSSNLLGGLGIVLQLPEEVEKIDNKFIVSAFDALKEAKRNANQ